MSHPVVWAFRRLVVAPAVVALTARTIDAAEAERQFARYPEFYQADARVAQPHFARA